MTQLQTDQRCLFRGCTSPPTRVVETDVGLEGGLAMYFCEAHAEEFMQASENDETDKLDLDRAEPEGNREPES